MNKLCYTTKGPYCGSFCFERAKMTLAVLNSYVKEVNKRENIANKVNVKLSRNGLVIDVYGKAYITIVCGFTWKCTIKQD